MKMIQNILKKTKASKLWFAMAVVLIAILNVSTVEAKSLKKGEEFKGKDGEVIRVVSSDEVEIEYRTGIFLGKYTVDGERVRVVLGVFGTSKITYYIIIPEGLVEEKKGKVFYTKAALAAEEKMLKTEESRKVALEFTFIGDEVIDKKTGLIWRRCAEGMVYKGGTCSGTARKFTYEQALQHAADQVSSTGKAWRVPEKDELVSIVDKSFSNPRIHPTAFPATPAEVFWSASPYDGSSAFAWNVGFGDGYVCGNGGHCGRNYSYYVRLVRADEKAKAGLSSVKFTFMGNFSGDEANCSTDVESCLYDVELWRDPIAGIIGHVNHPVMEADTPAGLIEHVKYDPSNGTLSFQAVLPSGWDDDGVHQHHQILKFVGKLTVDTLNGTFTSRPDEKGARSNSGVHVVLKKEDNQNTPKYKDIAEWQENYSKPILKFRGPR